MMRGPPGLPGPKGEPGERGYRGEKGSKGDTGSPGRFSRANTSAKFKRKMDDNERYLSFQLLRATKRLLLAIPSDLMDLFYSWLGLRVETWPAMPLKATSPFPSVQLEQTLSPSLCDWERLNTVFVRFLFSSEKNFINLRKFAQWCLPFYCSSVVGKKSSENANPLNSVTMSRVRACLWMLRGENGILFHFHVR